jgi:hypothetical protein
VSSHAIWPERPPRIPEIGVIGLVPNYWTDLWQPRHQVMRRLAAFFNVVWMNPAPEWRALVGRGSPRRGTVPGEERAGGGWVVYQPPAYLPVVYRPRAVGRRLTAMRLRQARRLLAERGARRFVLYLWRPRFDGALEHPHDLSVYHIDDEYAPDPNREDLDPREVALIERVDQVIIHSPRLMERKGGLNPRTANVPNGVDYRTFAEPRAEPVDLAPIGRPRIGYSGWLKPQLDWALIDEVVASCPGYNFVFVGAIKHGDDLARLPGFAALKTRPNAVFLGRKAPEDLPAYPQHFDVCTMPYLVTPYTDCIYPLKLHEYLATGRPTVGTPIRALQDFGGVVSLARDAGEWRAALAQALSPAAITAAAAEARRRVAREHDWWVLVAKIARLIGERLGHPLAPQLAAEPGADRDPPRRRGKL